MKKLTLLILALFFVLTPAGCSNLSPEADTVQFHNKTFNCSDLSNETLEWLKWYNCLTEEEQLAVSYIPADLYALCGYPAAEDAAAAEAAQNG